MLAEASIVLQLTNTRTLETQTFLAAATELSSVQQEQQRTEQGVAKLAAQTSHTKTHILTLLNAQKTILDSLTASSSRQVDTATSTGSSGSTTAKYTGPTTTQAEKAVAFVFAQLGCPYVYGSTGPCADGFDCSGLVMSAWASAGVTIPRDTYEQWAALPHISDVRHPARRPAVLQRHRARRDVRRKRDDHRRADAGPERRRDPDEHVLVRRQLRRRRASRIVCASPPTLAGPCAAR